MCMVSGEAIRDPNLEEKQLPGDTNDATFRQKIIVASSAEQCSTF